MLDPLIGPVHPPGLHVMTWNIRRRMTGPLVRSRDRWARRAGAVAAVLDAERPAILCAQEVMPAQARVLHEALGPGYARIGAGRGRGGRGEGTPIFYDRDRLQLIDAEVQALSARPGEPGSRSWGNPIPRMLVRAVVRDTATSQALTVVNTHLDPFSPRSRRRSAAAIRRLVIVAGTPVVVTGDLNADTSSSTIVQLCAGGLLRDALGAASRLAAPIRGTFGRYRMPSPAAPRLDWVLVSPGVRVVTGGVDPAAPDGIWPSDHLPVHAVIEIGAGA